MYTWSLRVFIIGCPALLQAVSGDAVCTRKVAGSIPDGFIEVFYSLISASTLRPWGRLGLKRK
jgi:hypothetical protein